MATPVADVVQLDQFSSTLWTEGGPALARHSIDPSYQAVPPPSYMQTAYELKVIPRQAKYQATPKDALPWVGPVHIGRQYKPQYSPVKLSSTIGNHTSCPGHTGLVHPSVTMSARLPPESADSLVYHRYGKVSRPSTTGHIHEHSTSGGLGESLTRTAVLLPPISQGQSTMASADHFHTGRRMIASMQRLSLAEERVKQDASDAEARAQRYWLGSFLDARADKMERPKSRQLRKAQETRRVEESTRRWDDTFGRSLPHSPKGYPATPRCHGHGPFPSAWASYQEYPGAPTPKQTGLYLTTTGGRLVY